MIPRMVEVSKFNGKSWEPSGNAVFHGFFSDYEEFETGPGNYPVALIEWEDGKLESVVARSVRFLVPTLTLEAIKEQVQAASWLSKEMQKTGTPAGCLPVLREEWFPEDGSKVRVRNPQGLSPQSRRLYAGKVGRVTKSHKDTGLCYVAFDTSWGRFRASELEPVA